MPLFEAAARHSGGRLDGVDRFRRLRNQEWAMGGPEKTCGLERLHLEIFAAGRSLANVDECGDIRMARPERARNYRAQMRSRNRLRWDIARVPVVLMP